VVSRFASPAVRDTLDRICTDASDRIPKFLLPVLRANLASGGEIRRSVAVLAGWAHSLTGTDDAGRPVEVVDARRDALLAAARRQDDDPLAFVRDRDVFGDLADDPRFAGEYRAALESLRTRGARATVEAVVRGR
jgi:mannitol 2-dehydrogenase